MESRQHAAKDTTKSLVDLVAEDHLPGGGRRGMLLRSARADAEGATSVSMAGGAPSRWLWCRGGAAPCELSCSSRGPCSICTLAGRGPSLGGTTIGAVISSLPSWTAFSPLQSLHMLLPSPPSPPGRVDHGSVLSPRSIAERKLPPASLTVSPCRLHVCAMPALARLTGRIGRHGARQGGRVILLGESAIRLPTRRDAAAARRPSESGRRWRAS